MNILNVQPILPKPINRLLWWMGNHPLRFFTSIAMGLIIIYLLFRTIKYLVKRRREKKLWVNTNIRFTVVNGYDLDPSYEIELEEEV